MYKVNDYLVYRKEVCKVMEVKEKHFRDRDYYTLIPVNDPSLKIDIPTDNKFIRSIMSKEAVEKIIDLIPNITELESTDKLIENEYKKLIDNETSEDLVKIIKTTYSRNKVREDNNKKISEKDDKYFKKAEDYLYNEFAIALNMSYDQVKKYVSDRVEKLKD